MEWVVRLHGPGVQHVESVAVSNVGDVAVVGTYDGTLQIDSRADGIGQPSDGSDVFVARFTSSGELQWLKTFVGVGEQRGEALAFDSVGNVILAVRNSGTVNFGGGNKIAAGESDAVLVKLNTAGGHVDSWLYTSPGEALIHDVAVGANDDILVGGAFNLSLVPEPGKQLVMGSPQMTGFVARLKSDGFPKWIKLLSGPATSYVYGLDLSGSNKVVFAGAYAQGTLVIDGDNLVHEGEEDAFAARIDGDTKVLLWADRAGDELGQNVRQVGLGSAGTVLFAGSYRGALGSSLLNPSMVEDAYLLQYSGDQEMWSLSVGTGLPLQSRALDVGSTGASIWGGDLRGNATLGECSLSSPNPGFFLSEVSADGEVVWATAYSAGSAAGIEGVVYRKSTAVAAVGWHQGAMSLGDVALPAPVDASEDSFLVRLDPSR